VRERERENVCVCGWVWVWCVCGDRVAKTRYVCMRLSWPLSYRVAKTLFIGYRIPYLYRTHRKGSYASSPRCIIIYFIFKIEYRIYMYQIFGMCHVYDIPAYKHACIHTNMHTYIPIHAYIHTYTGGMVGTNRGAAIEEILRVCNRKTNDIQIYI